MSDTKNARVPSNAKALKSRIAAIEGRLHSTYSVDVGPGAGHQLFRFSHPENITAIYGAEPGIDMHAALQGHAKKAGLGEKYKIVC